jgi:hypothetical protein
VEIKETLGMALWTAGASTYIAGSGYPLDKFKQETDTIIRHVQSQMAQKKAA